MKEFGERLADVSLHLQSLTDPSILPEVQDAVEREDKNSLITTFRKARIPEIYFSTLAAVLLTVAPQQKWPEVW